MNTPAPSGEDFFRCPTCLHVDMVQKVSAIYSAGNFTTAQQSVTVGLGVPLSSSALASAFGIGAVTSSSGTSQSQLSALLSPPPPPPKHSERLVEWIGGGLLLVIGLFELAAGLLGTDGGAYERILMAVCGAGMLIASPFVFRTAVRTRASYPAELQKAQEKARSAAHRWSNSYICLRDETVFDPWRGRAAPLSSFRRFLESEE